MKRQPIVVTAIVVTQLFFVAQVGAAATIDCATGDIQCLIAAINQANADVHHKTTIRLAGAYILTNIDNTANGPNGLPSVLTNVTIDGGNAGATLTRQPTSEPFRIFHVAPSGHLTLRSLSVSNGGGSLGGGLYNNGGLVKIIDSSFVENGTSGDTGAVFNNHGAITIVDSTFTGNFGSSGAGVVNAGGIADINGTLFDNNDGLAAGGVNSIGGATWIDNSRFTRNTGHLGVGGVRVSGGTVSIRKTTFSDNEGDPAGGMLVESHGNLAVLDSALVTNIGVGAGGGIFNADGTVNVTNTTFAGNIVGGAGAFQGSAVLNGGTMRIVNSTFATAPGHGGDSNHPATTIEALSTIFLENTIVVHNADDLFVQDCGGAVTSLGNNLIGDPFACNMMIQLTDRIGDAGLGDLVDDGTAGNAHHLLLPDSEAIDAANRRACPVRDQIGQPRRPQCDIGAVEFDDQGLGLNTTK